MRLDKIEKKAIAAIIILVAILILTAFWGTKWRFGTYIPPKGIFQTEKNGHQYLYFGYSLIHDEACPCKTNRTNL